MDLSQTTAPRSDQQNYDDYVSGPKVVTVAEVKKGNSEQPVEIHLVEFPGRPYKPNKSMRRVLSAAWGPDTTPYPGRRMKLYGDPHVKWAGQEVGGIRIGALSNLDKPLKVALTVTRGKREPYTVQPLEDAPPAADYAAQVAAAQSVDELRNLWTEANNAGALTDELTAAINSKREELS